MKSIHERQFRVLAILLTVILKPFQITYFGHKPRTYMTYEGVTLPTAERIQVSVREELGYIMNRGKIVGNRPRTS